MAKASERKRVLSKVRVGGSLDCWPWLASVRVARGGYGQVRFGGTMRLAHRVVFELLSGRAPVGYLCHSCDNPLCCNPAHMFEGTQADNMRDAAEKNRVVHGERSNLARLSESAVGKIREAYASGETQKDIARRYGIARSNVSHIVTGKSWRRTGCA